MMSAKPKVVYWNLAISPYVVGRFNAVVRRNNLRFEAWFSEARMAERSWQVNPAQWEFPARIIPSRPLFGRPLQVPLIELREVAPAVLVSGYWNASWVLASFAASAMGARTVFSVLPASRTWSPRTRRKEALKHFLFRAVDAVAVPGTDAAAYSSHYGVPGDRIFRVAESIDVDHYTRACEVNGAAREQARRQLGLHGCVFLYVGRLRSEKGLDYLFEAYLMVRRHVPDVSLLLVGDGVDEARYREMASGIAGVVFAGFVQPDHLPGYYALGDALVFPTLGDSHGLVVEEAMAAGLPVICTEAAGGIRHRLRDAQAGYIVPARDSSALAGRMLRLARDGTLRKTFGREARAAVHDCGHLRFAQDLENLVHCLLDMPARRTAQARAARAIGSLLSARDLRRPPVPGTADCESTLSVPRQRNVYPTGQ
jgi:glycosyltransferase involved in cell wall biosynthesis